MAATKRSTTQRTFLWIAEDRVLPVVMHTRRALTPFLTDLAVQVRQRSSCRRGASLLPCCRG